MPGLRGSKATGSEDSVWFWTVPVRYNHSTAVWLLVSLVGVGWSPAVGIIRGDFRIEKRKDLSDTTMSQKTVSTSFVS